MKEMEKLRKEMKETNATVVDVPGCIMDSPQKLMSIPSVDLDVKNLVDIVIETSKKKSGPRKKPVCATVRGMGEERHGRLKRCGACYYCKKVCLFDHYLFFLMY